MYVFAAAASAAARPGAMRRVPRPRRWWEGCTARMWRTVGVRGVWPGRGRRKWGAGEGTWHTECVLWVDIFPASSKQLCEEISHEALVRALDPGLCLQFAIFGFLSGLELRSNFVRIVPHGESYCIATRDGLAQLRLCKCVQMRLGALPGFIVDQFGHYAAEDALFSDQILEEFEVGFPSELWRCAWVKMRNYLVVVECSLENACEVFGVAGGAGVEGVGHCRRYGMLI